MTDPVTLQLVASGLLFASEEMGLALRNSAYSPNIKERMDHSAAIFDAEGRLLAQAEHIPVHLGSLPWGLKNLVRFCAHRGPEMEEGSMIVSNDPYLTGTHLNDVTVLAPLHHRGALIGFAVNKAHHSDVGGRVPGSISMSSRSLQDEGFVLEPAYLWRSDSFVRRTVEEFANASRTPGERRGDLRAQVAANVQGGRRTLEIVSKYGIDVFEESARHAFAHSTFLMKRSLSRFRPGRYSAVDHLEGKKGRDIILKTEVEVTSSQVHFDYTGTHAEVDYPLNAVLGVTISGVYFVLRALTGSDIPANHGAFASISVSVPKGTILNPTSPHPVGGGNVETSQRNADLVFKALSRAVPERVPAAAGGSMNNVMAGGSWKGSTWAFYETVGVGLGGSKQADGVDGIQANMTNTMNTPIEEMERVLPIMMTRYELRPDSGGPGKHRGGTGLIRSYKILADQTTFTILAERERRRPWGLKGGGEGEGTRIFVKSKGKTARVPSKSTLLLDSGDEVEVRTAGGGGFGDPSAREIQDIMEDLESGLVSKIASRRAYGVRIRRRARS